MDSSEFVHRPFNQDLRESYVPVVSKPFQQANPTNKVDPFSRNEIIKQQLKREFEEVEALRQDNKAMQMESELNEIKA